MGNKLSAEVRFKTLGSTLGETTGGEEVRHIQRAKFVGVFETDQDVEVEILFKGDKDKIQAILHDLNTPYIKDFTVVEFLSNPQVRMEEIETNKDKRKRAI